ncbi:MAG: Rrf2 family transcriptional regulator [Opitutae bacterium]|jgi:Rrf2 family transcriptional regulator, nitric oxide-sensitive transcriptional repressor|nr:Rrf2 family transcriptional regulator [Opitutae bacterium]MBT5909760.1 Rrf2 family transcriptional regulator [Opitutae bacterium]MBT6852209.1 Rrf2 family transcriptional regulator [Opitutae bacterium]MBT7741060.1 Rrf2 family transcriptional regulator [Opitutae bacterium]MBT7923622.1 Rrf2 family transcriptional regulator [Opitutae bacterium]
MELSQFTDYSLRVLIYVSLREDKLSSVKDIAESYGISQNHLVKVVHNLSKLGYLETFRGRGGGIALGKPPEEVKVGELVRATENMSILECIPPRKGGCCLAGVCELQSVLVKAIAAFMAELDKVTLADLMKGKTSMLRRLNLS